MNANIAEYHVPVNADVHDIKVIFVDEPDDINPLGIKGWARSASSASRPRSPTRSITPPASASATCQSRWINLRKGDGEGVETDFIDGLHWKQA